MQFSWLSLLGLGSHPLHNHHPFFRVKASMSQNFERPPNTNYSVYFQHTAYVPILRIYKQYQILSKGNHPQIQKLTYHLWILPGFDAFLSLSLSFVAGFARKFRCQPDVQRCEPSRLHMIKTAVKIGDVGASINSRSNDMIRFSPSCCF